MTSIPIRPKEGQGAYNRSSRVQASGLLPAVALLEQAAKSAALARPAQALVIADYGCSEGRNSLLPMAAAIGALRKRVGSEREISIVHTDLPDNDFKALFQTLEADPASYLNNDAAAFASAIGRSFYRQLLPSNSVTLGWSSWAIQWLSRVPATIPDQVHIAYSSDAAAREAFARQAAEDWRTFLVHRGRELRPGGRLVVQTMAIDADDRFGYQPLLEAISATLLEMVDDGVIHAEEMHRMVIPTVGRSKENLAAPFLDGSVFAGLAIEHLDVYSGEDGIWTQFEASGDANAYGAQWAAFSRASVFPTLAAALEGDRDASRSHRFMDRLEAGVAARLAKAASRMLIPLARILLLKKES